MACRPRPRTHCATSWVSRTPANCWVIPARCPTRSLRSRPTPGGWSTGSQAAVRYETSTETATTVLRRPGADQRPLVIASGANFPDGLSAAALAARTGGVLLMVPLGDLAQAPSTGRGRAPTGRALTACSSSAARLRSATRWPNRDGHRPRRSCGRTGPPPVGGVDTPPATHAHTSAARRLVRTSIQWMTSTDRQRRSPPCWWASRVPPDPRQTRIGVGISSTSHRRSAAHFLRVS